MTDTAAGDPRVFTRRASGLVRVAGAWDTFIFNIGLVSVGIAIALNQYYGPSLYGGASIWISTLLATGGMLVVAGTFYMWSIIFPRSGGVYLSLSRSLSPGGAFVLTLVETVILLYYAAFASSLIVTVGFASFLGAVGAVAGSPTLIGWSAALNTPQGIFWCGSAVLVAAGLLLASGTRRYFRTQQVLFVIAMLGTAVIIVVLAAGSRETFRAKLQALAGLDYDQVIAAAQASGWTPAPFDLGQTVAFLVWPLLPLLGAVQSVAIGGEIKRVNRSQFLGMFGAVIVSGALIALVAVLSDRVFGYDFQAAIAWNSLNAVAGGSIEGSVGAAPWFTVLASLLTGSLVLTAVIMATFVAWIWFWIPAEIAYTTRTMVAWSLDRIGPDALARVSPRLHTPVVAIGLSTAVAVVIMAFIAFAKIAFLTLIEVLLVIWGAVMISAVLFPYQRRELFRMSPVARLKLAGVPLMAILGALGAVFFLGVVIALWFDPIAAGPLVSADGVKLEFWVVLGLLVLGIFWYVGARVYRRKQGVDIDLAFKQIPVE